MNRFRTPLLRFASSWAAMLAVAACVVSLLPLPAAAQQTWTTGTSGITDGSGTWASSGGTNWFNGTTYGAWASGTGVIGGGTGNPGTITISGAVGAQRLTIGKNYLLTGGTLTITTASGLDVSAGVSGTIASYLRFSNVSSNVNLLTSSGTLTLSGGFDFGGNSAGSNLNGTLIQTAGSGTIAPSSGGAFRFGNGGSFTITGGTFAVGAGGRLVSVSGSSFQQIDGGVVRYSTTTQANNVGNGLQLRLLSGEMAANNLTLNGSGTGSVGAGGVFILGGGTYRPATTNASLGSSVSGSNFSITVNGLSSVLSGLDAGGTARNLDVFANLTGAGGITYTSGTVTLSGSNTYSGPTTVSAGTRLVLASSGSLGSTSSVQTNGTLDLTAKSSGITFGNDQLLSGIGSVLMPSATVGISGTLSPGGGSIGTLSFANAGILDISSAVGGANTGRLLFGLGSNQATTDLVSLTSGSLAIGSGLLGFDDFAFSPSGLQVGTYTLFSASGITGTLVSDTAARSGSLGGNFTGTLQQTGTAIELVVVPEPATIVLAVTAIGGVAVFLRRRRCRGVPASPAGRGMIGRPAAICRRGSGIVSTVIALSLLAGGARGAAISELKATHRDGQTFLTWQEADTPGADDSLSIADSMKLAAEWKPRLAFRVYRADKPIASVAGLEPIGTTGPLSCWNAAFPVEHKFGPQDMMARFVIEEGKPPLAAGTGLYVHNPAAVGKAYYAVVAVLDGKEVGTASTAVAVDEKPGIGVPVLQSTRKLEGKEEFNFVAGPTLHTFIRWEAPPHANRENMASEILVAVPKNLPQPASLGLHLHCWGGSPKGGYGWWFNAEKGAILVAPNQYPYDWWTGYHERYGLGPRDERSWKDGVVHPYTQRRVLSLLDWAATRWQVDPSQTFVAGNSMGGSGAPMLALRHPQRFAWAVGWVGIHVPELSDHFKASYANVYGDPAWNVKFEDGTPVWEHFNDAAYLRKHVEQDTPFLTWSNGRNDAAIGWKQAVEFAAAMQETKRPHIFMWGNNGHNQRALMPLSLEQRVNPLDLRVDQSQPAFTRCSLDGKPGNGDPGDGDAEGNFNLYLFWDTKDVVDDADAWEMTVGLAPKAPEAECRVDLTPRRLQRFKPRAGETLQWTNTSGGKEVQAGTVKVDAHGLATIEGLTVGKDRNRVRVTRGR